MIITQVKPEKKEVNVFVVPTEVEESSNSWYQEQINYYEETGYTINSLVYPVGSVPAEVQETYNNAYSCKAMLDRLIDTATGDLMTTTLREVVRQEISKFSIEDIAESMKD